MSERAGERSLNSESVAAKEQLKVDGVVVPLWVAVVFLALVGCRASGGGGLAALGASTKTTSKGSRLNNTKLQRATRLSLTAILIVRQAAHRSHMCPRRRARDCRMCRGL